MATSGAAGKWLLDTGPLVALLSRRDAAHEQCVDVLSALRGSLITTEAVLTEAMHMVGRRGWDPCLDFLERGGALLVPIDPPRLRRCRELVARYQDVPMDFADSTLVALAEQLDTGDVFTLDRRGFSTYRWNRTRRFSIAP